MILVDWEIADYIKHGYIGIEPFDEYMIQPNSLDVRLGNNFVWYDKSDDVIDPFSTPTFYNHVNSVVEKDYFDLMPGQFVLAETLEKVTLPDNVVASIEGKSSIARLGVTLHQTGGWIDAGFSGTITLEMFNSNARPVRLYAGMSIGQLVFYPTKSCSMPYDKIAGAKYQNQSGATISKYFLNKRRT